MRTKITSALLGLFLLVCATHAFADMHPLIPTEPSVCTPPTGPAPGQLGYGPLNPFTNGIYFNPDTGFWNIPDGLWNPEGSTFDREVRDAELVEIINDLVNPPPVRPDWAIFDMETDGTYYWGGGYWDGHYFAAGYYLPEEIW